jgi:copper transport protein
VGGEVLNKKQRISVFLIILYIILTSFPSISSAHAYIVQSTPSDNEILKSSPKKVTIQFDESIQAKFNSIKVTDSSGRRVDTKDGSVEPTRPSILKVGLKNNLASGTYRIQWRVISDDGHPVQGVIPFQIGSGTANNTESIQTKGYIPKADLVVIRWVQFLANACVVGIFFFSIIVLSKELQGNRLVEKSISKLVWTGIIFLTVSIILNLPLQATLVLGSKWSEVLSFAALGQVLGFTVFGKLWLMQIALLFTLVLTTHFLSMADSTKRLISWICLFLGMGLLLTKSFSSHAASAVNKTLAISIDFIHLLAASIWIGSLFGLAVLLPLSKTDDLKGAYLDTIRRFSKWGILLVLLLVATGIFNGFQYVPTVSSLFRTGYGKLLISKVLLFICMLIFAAVNFQKGRKGKAKNLTTSLWGELTIGGIILLLTVLLTNLPTANASPGPFYKINTVDNGNQVSLRVTPNVLGENSYIIHLKTKNGKPMNNIEQITLTFQHSEMDMGKDTIRLTKAGNGLFKGKNLNLNMSGKWNIHIHVLTEDLDNIDTDFHIMVGSQ